MGQLILAKNGATVQFYTLSDQAGSFQQRRIKHLRWRRPNKLQAETAADNAASASQPSIKNYAANKRDKAPSEASNNLIAEMGALDMQPASTVEDDVFLKLMKHLEPG